MMPTENSANPPAERRPSRLGKSVFLALIGFNILIELSLQAADAGLVGSSRWRALAYQNGAFWAGLLHGWQPNYSAQPVTMFFSYAFLHAGFWHLATNMLVLWGLGLLLIQQIGQRALLGLYLLSALGGGLGFGLLSTSPQPMVGASGAIFGLIGVWKHQEWLQRRADNLPLWPLWRSLAGFLALNVLMWVLVSGQLAWETHLGGFVAGWAGSTLLTRFRRG